MKAVAEYWTTGDRFDTSNYRMIALNPFGSNGLGLEVSRALVVKARIPSGENGEKVYQYTFLWILDLEAEDSLDLTSGNLYFARETLCDVFHLSGVKLLSDDKAVGDMEQQMLRSSKQSDVELIEKIFNAEDSSSKLHSERKLGDSESPLAKKARAVSPVSAMCIAEQLIYDINICCRSRLSAAMKVVRGVRLSIWLCFERSVWLRRVGCDERCLVSECSVLRYWIIANKVVVV
jgi:hypothetical protein